MSKMGPDSSMFPPTLPPSFYTRKMYKCSARNVIFFPNQFLFERSKKQSDAMKQRKHIIKAYVCFSCIISYNYEYSNG